MTFCLSSNCKVAFIVPLCPDKMALPFQLHQRTYDPTWSKTHETCGKAIISEDDHTKTLPINARGEWKPKMALTGDSSNPEAGWKSVITLIQ